MCEGGGGEGGEEPLADPADAGTARMNDSHWAPSVEAGAGAEGGRGGQSWVSVGAGEDFPRGGVGFRGTNSARRRAARGAARIRNRAHRKARRPPGCRRAGARSTGLDEGTWVSRGGASAGTGAAVSVENRDGMKNPRGGERPGETGADDGSLCRDLVGRSVEGRASAGGPVLVDRSWACGPQGSR